MFDLRRFGEAWKNNSGGFILEPLKVALDIATRDFPDESLQTTVTPSRLARINDVLERIAANFPVDGKSRASCAEGLVAAYDYDLFGHT